MLLERDAPGTGTKGPAILLAGDLFYTALVTATLEGVQEETLDVSLFPNPANGQVTVTAEGICRVEIRNLLGQQVVSMEGNGSESFTIDLSGLAKGVYLVTVWNKEGAGTTKKLTVE